MTDRAGRWATAAGRPVRPLGQRGRRRARLRLAHHQRRRDRLRHTRCVEDPDRIGEVDRARARRGALRPPRPVADPDVVDPDRRRRVGQLLDVIPGRSAAGLCAWLADQDQAWLDGIGWATLDLSGPWRLAFDTMLPDAVQVADPFHVVKLANQRLDEVRRRVQNETLGHRGHKDDPLYRSRRLLTEGRRTPRRPRPQRSCSDCSRPATRGARSAWRGTPRKSSARSTTIDDPDLAVEFVDRLGADLQDGRARRRSASSAARSSAGGTRSPRGTKRTCRNGPTEAVNNLIKRVKRVAFGFRRSATTGSAPCSTPASPTGTYSPPSHPAEIRSALNITQKHSRPNHPTTCGKVERFHQTLKRWLAARPLRRHHRRAARPSRPIRRRLQPPPTPPAPRRPPRRSPTTCCPRPPPAGIHRRAHHRDPPRPRRQHRRPVTAPSWPHAPHRHRPRPRRQNRAHAHRTTSISGSSTPPPARSSEHLILDPTRDYQPQQK